MSKRLKRTVLSLECDFDGSDFTHSQGKDSLPAQTFGRSHSRNWTFSA